MQDPEIFLADLKLGVPCAVNPDRRAIIDAAYRVSVGYETYFFCDSAALTTFRQNVTAYCGTLTDPVTRQRFLPDRNTPSSILHDRLYLFASDSSKQAFDMMPETYAWPTHQMILQDTATSH